MEKLNVLGGFIREKRKTRKYTISKLAEKSGVDSGYISRLERGEKTNPSAEVLVKIADALNVGKSEILAMAGILDNEDVLQNENAEDFKVRFFAELEEELGLDISDPNVQKLLKRAAKVMFASED